MQPLIVHIDPSGATIHSRAWHSSGLMPSKQLTPAQPQQTGCGTTQVPVTSLQTVPADPASQPAGQAVPSGSTQPPLSPQTQQCSPCVTLFMAPPRFELVVFRTALVLLGYGAGPMPTQVPSSVHEEFADEATQPSSSHASTVPWKQLGPSHAQHTCGGAQKPLRRLQSDPAGPGVHPCGQPSSGSGLAHPTSVCASSHSQQLSAPHVQSA